MLASRRAFKFGAAAAVGLAISLGGIGAAKALYDVKPEEISGKPGSLIRVWPLEGGGGGSRAMGTLSVFFTAPPGRRANRSQSRARSSYRPDPYPPAAATLSLGRTQLQASCRLARHR